MLYAIFCYNDEAAVGAWSKAEDDACMARLGAVQSKHTAAGKMGPVVRLLPTSSATTLRKKKDEAIVLDGPFAETKEQLLGFYVIDVSGLEEGLEIARELAKANPSVGAFELRPVGIFSGGAAMPESIVMP